MDNSLVSVLIPVFNREKYIKETVESAINQSYKNIEIIIVDNASTDNTWNIIKSMAESDNRIKIFRNKENIGPVKNWKKCIEKSTGKYGKILWSDDLIESTFLEKSVPLMENGSNDIGFVYSNSITIDEDSQPVYKHGQPTNKQNTTSEFIKHETSHFIKETLAANKDFPVSPACALFRTSDLRKNLLIDIPNSIGVNTNMLAIGNDLLLFLLACNDYKYYYHIAESLSLFRAHEGSITISSKRGEVLAFYTMATAYFITVSSNIDQDTIYKFNARSFLDYRRKNLKRFGFPDWRSFYPNPEEHKMDIKLILYIASHKIKKKIRKLRK